MAVPTKCEATQDCLGHMHGKIAVSFSVSPSSCIDTRGNEFQWICLAPQLKTKTNKRSKSNENFRKPPQNSIPLRTLSNKSLQPTDRKLVNITSIFKKDDSNLLCIYSPISSTSVIEKVLKIINRDT